MRTTILLLLAFPLLFSNCKEESPYQAPKQDEPKDEVKDPKLTSTFADGEFMPNDCGKNNGNFSPLLMLKNIPANTVEMAVTMRDIDNGNSWHWAVWNIPPTKTEFSKGESWSGDGVTVGANDYGTGYIGPFPPSVHQYKITVYFLNAEISLTPAQYKSLPATMSGKIISEVSITGKYQ